MSLALDHLRKSRPPFPGRFGDSVLDAYAAAVRGRKETNSSVAADLEYCHSLIEEKPAVPKVTLTVIAENCAFSIQKVLKIYENKSVQ